MRIWHMRFHADVRTCILDISVKGSTLCWFYMGIAQTALGMVSRKKVAVLLDFVQITSPQFVPLFFNAKNVDLSNIQNDSLSKILLK